MSTLRNLLLAIMLFAWPALAQDSPVNRVAVTVVSASEGIVQLDRGRRSGIEIGDRVRLFPPTQPTLEATVRSVRENTCTVELRQSGVVVEPGNTGEVLVPVDRQASSPLPWTAPAEDYDQSQPLLLGRATPAEERPTTWRGRLYLQGEWTDIESQDPADYLFANLGLDLAYENPFGNGGRLHFNADAFSRTANLDFGFDVDDSRMRFDRFSYAWGGTRERRDRWQVGRFLQYEFPELGVLDGVEYSHRLDNGSRIGSSFGYLPRVLDDFRLEDDLQAAVFYRHLAGPNNELSVGASYQRTWHGGRPDRDLILTTVDVRPAKEWTLFGTAWLDLYGSDAITKSSGLELTQLITGVTWADQSGQGANLSLSQTRWPELLRDEIPITTPTLLANGKVERLRVQGWRPLSSKTRLRGSFDHWSDEETSGSGGELFFGIRDWLWKRGELSAALYSREGKFDDVFGLRLNGYKNTEFGSFRGTIDTATAEAATFGGTVDEGQLRLRASWDRNLGVDWYLSIYAQRVSIDTVDTSTLGFHLQWSF